MAQSPKKLESALAIRLRTNTDTPRAWYEQEVTQRISRVRLLSSVSDYGRGGGDVGRGLCDGVLRGVAVAVVVAVGVAVAVGVTVDNGVIVALGAGVAVGVGVTVADGVAVGVGVGFPAGQ